MAETARSIISKHLPWFVSVLFLITIGGVGLYFGVSDLLERFSPEKQVEWTEKRMERQCAAKLFAQKDGFRWCLGKLVWSSGLARDTVLECAD